ncbi:GTPase IMAP family member 4-like isoform X2 [Cololabis saira]|nr:GTPase IMAP family member 4-like isoform X2 [Cololabis saira]
MECQCEHENAGDAAPDWWLSSNNAQMGAFAVVGYFLYRFSQTLPALVRWPIRVFCSLTGLSALWGWVSHLVRTLRGIQRLMKWLSRIWRFFARSIAGFSESQRDPTSGSAPNLTGEPSSTSNKPGLRLILLGPAGGGRTSLADSLLGSREVRASVDALMVSTRRRGVMDGRELTLIDTPDVLGTSLENDRRAREALRSLQLTSPGPHAFLLVIRAAGSSVGSDAVQAVQATMKLFGEGVTGHIIPVLTHVDRLGGKQTVDELMESDAGSLKRAVSMCGQTPVLVEEGPDLPPQAQSVLRRHLVGRVMEMKELQGLFVHELQRREDHLQEELLADMSSTLAGKLGHV